jgi:MFS family permease
VTLRGSTVGAYSSILGPLSSHGRRLGQMTTVISGTSSGSSASGILGLGAEVPLVFTYLSEFLPARHRGVLIASIVALWQASSFVSALLAIYIVPRLEHGSQSLVSADANASYCTKVQAGHTSASVPGLKRELPRS